jgi:hypothetical protein
MEPERRLAKGWLPPIKRTNCWQYEYKGMGIHQPGLVMARHSNCMGAHICD